MNYRKQFDRRVAALPTEIWSKIAAIEELKGRWIGSVKLHPQILGRLKQSVLITSTGASTRIEGAEMSDEDIEKFLRGIGLQTFKDRDKQEVKGYYELLANVFKSWDQLRSNESTIKHFHQELLKYVDKDRFHRGEYKKAENKVIMINRRGESVGTLFQTTPPYLTPSEMDELIDWTRKALREKKYHPLLVIGNFIVEFLNIHPFTDGNGRLSRILTNLLLLQEGYHYMPYVSQEKIIEDNKPDYYLALRKSQKTIKKKIEDIIPWLQFFLKVLYFQSKIAVELLSRPLFEELLSEKQLKVWRYIEAHDEVSPREISKATQTSRPTVNQILKKLLQLKKIQSIGLGRATRYRKLI